MSWTSSWQKAMASIDSISPREWQKDALSNLLSTDDNILIQASTGAGKTVFACLYLHKSKKKAVIIVHTLSLMKQWHDELTTFGMNFFTFHGNRNEVPDDTQIILSTYQTWHKNTRCFNPDVLVLDEAHKSTNESYQTIFERHDHARRIGISATPVSPIAAETLLSDIYDRLLITSTTTELMAAGVILRPHMVDATSLDAKTEKVLSKEKGEFTATTLSKAAKLDGADAFGASKAWERYVRPLGNKRTLVFAVDIAHARVIKKDFDKLGVPSAVLVSTVAEDDLDKDEVATKLTSGEIEVVISVNQLSEGFNSPMAATAILCRPTRNIALAIQQQGRVLRSHEGKDFCQIIDCANVFLSTCLPTENVDWDHMFKHGLEINPWAMLEFGEWVEGGGLETAQTPEEIALELEAADEDVLVGHCNDHGGYVVKFEDVVQLVKNGEPKTTQRPQPCPTCILVKQLNSKATVKKRLTQRYSTFKDLWVDYTKMVEGFSSELTQPVINSVVGSHKAAPDNQKVFYMNTVLRMFSLLERSSNPDLIQPTGWHAGNTGTYFAMKRETDKVHKKQMEVNKAAKEVLKTLRELRHSGVDLSQNIFCKQGNRDRLTHTLKNEFQQELLSVKALLEVWEEHEYKLSNTEINHE